MALRLPVIRLLIADDVGIGKTVEAGLIVRELLDRGEVERFSVLCPPILWSSGRSNYVLSSRSTLLQLPHPPPPVSSARYNHLRRFSTLILSPSYPWTILKRIAAARASRERVRPSSWLMKRIHASALRVSPTHCGTKIDGERHSQPDEPSICTPKANLPPIGSHRSPLDWADSWIMAGNAWPLVAWLRKVEERTALSISRCE